MYACVHVCMCVHMCVYIYIYIYISRERERERERETDKELAVIAHCLYVYISKNPGRPEAMKASPSSPKPC